MTRDELIAAVPIHHVDGRPSFVDLTEIPVPWRRQFDSALAGSACPGVAGVDDLAYACDWLAWANDRWAGRPGRFGLLAS